jgi:multicomponent Na+:H+ antiporter subunit B
MLEFFFVSNDQLSFAHSTNLLIVLTSILLLIAIYLVFETRLLINIIALSFFSFVISACYLLMDAPDVAMTETALGVCLSTCIFLSVLKNYNGTIENVKNSKLKIVITLLMIFCLIEILLYLGLNITSYGSNKTALHNNINQYFLKNTQKDIGIPSFVAAMLASYRGYDTLGETAVILIAGIAIVFIVVTKKSK